MIYMDRNAVFKIIVVVIPLDFTGEVCLFHAFCRFRGVNLADALLNLFNVAIVIGETRNVQREKEMFRRIPDYYTPSSRHSGDRRGYP